jgi:hypothetical protein
MADFNVGLGGVGFLRADFNGPRKKTRISPRETIQEAGVLPFGSLPGTFFASGLVADNNCLSEVGDAEKVQTYLVPALDHSHQNSQSPFAKPCFHRGCWTMLPSWSHHRIIRMNKMESLTSLAWCRWCFHPFKVHLLIFLRLEVSFGEFYCGDEVGI